MNADRPGSCEPLRSMPPDEFARQLLVFARDHRDEFLRLVRDAERAAPEAFARLRREEQRRQGVRPHGLGPW